MIASLKFDDLISACKTSRRPNGTHHGLRARIDHADHIKTRHQAAEQFSHLDFDLCGRTKAQPPLCSFHYRLLDLWMIMSQDHRSPGADVIKITFSFFVIYISAFRFFNEPRTASHRLVGPHRAVDASRQYPFGAVK